MNAYQRKKNCVAALTLAAVLLAAPAAASALETAPLVPGAQAVQQGTQRIATFGTQRGYLGVSASDKWLRQARVGGMMLNLRVFTAMGDEVVFREKLDEASTGGRDICLIMHASSRADSLMLQFDQHALDVLTRLGVTEIVTADMDGCVRLRYRVAELNAVRGALALGDAEQLCLSGESDPITVVSEDGVRRQVLR
ncbi:MAG: hypothetical protein ACI4PG_09770 [Candidatus Ventricola sp.]